MLKFFPLSEMAKQDVAHCVVVVLFYLFISWLTKFVSVIIGWIPLLGWLVSLVAWVIRLYCIGGIVVALLAHFNKI